MQMFTLKKPIKTVVKSFQKDGEGKLVKDADGNDILSGSREVLISSVQVPQYQTLAEIVQAAGNEEKVVKYFNDSVKADAVTPVRVVGAGFTLDDSDTDIIAKGLELASKFNPFADRRKGDSVKALADKMKEIQAVVNSGAATDAEIIAMIRGGAI